MTTEIPKKFKRKPKPPVPPIGNKYALGNDGGRPTEHDYIKYANDIVEWAKQCDSFNLIGFASKIGVLREQLYDFAAVSPEFSHALITARQLLILNREKLVSSGKLHQSIYNRYASLHDKELLLHERAEKAYEIELKTKAEHASLPSLDAIVERDNENMALKAQLAKMQEQLDNLTKARQKLPGSDT
jgi:hypothetical protein